MRFPKWAIPPKLLWIVSGVVLVVGGLAIRTATSAPGDAPLVASAFVDLNADGQWQGGEVPFTSLTVKAYDTVGGSSTGVLNTATNKFAIDVTGLTGSKFRVEFSGLTGDWKWGASGSGTDPTIPQAGSTVQFVAAGGTAVVAVDDPLKFCQDNPSLATNCYVSGNQRNDANSQLATLVGVDSTWGNDIKNPSDPDNPITGGVETLDTWQVDASHTPNDPRKLAKANEIGATFGLAWNRADGYVYASAFLKEFSGYGPGGPNAIYRIPMDPYTGLATGPATVFATVGTSTGFDPATGIKNKTFAATGGTGSVPVCDDLHGVDLTSAQYEAAVYANVYKCSFGDLDISADGSKLFVTNLKSKEVLQFSTATGMLENRYPVPVSNTTGFCTGVDTATQVWPFGLGVQDNNVFVGGVCNAWAASNPSGSNHYTWVMKLDVTTGTWTTVVNYRTKDNRYATIPWFDSYNAFMTYMQGSSNPANWTNEWITVSDVQVTDIEFFGNDLTLGLRGRSGDQGGNGIPDPTYPTRHIFMSGQGDLVCFYWDGTVYKREFNGTCGPDRHWSSLVGGADPYTYPDGGPGRGDDGSDNGGKGDEFYWGDGANDVYRGDPATSRPNHTEPAFGGLSQVNTSPLAFTGLNPPDALGGELILTGGIGWANSMNGSTFKAYLIYQSDLNNIWAGNMDPYFGKSNGLGDLEELCVRAPVEIGNRIWNDVDHDGIQDADEAPISGVSVSLYSSSGALLDRVTTDSQGRYVFRSVGPDGLSGNADDLFLPGDKVTIRVDNPVDFASGGVLDGWQMSPSSATDGSNPTPDDQDSDGVSGNVLALAGSASRLATASETGVTVGVAGENDHTWDFGYYLAPNLYSLGNRVWNDVNNNGVIDGSEAGVDGVKVNLYVDANDDGAPDGAAIATQDTSSGGYYLFTDLAAGTYLVEAVLPSGYVSSTGSGALTSPTPNEPAPDPDNGVDSDDNGTTSGTSVWSGGVTLDSSAPTGEPATPGHTDTAADSDSDLTVDFGIWRPYALGNVVFDDLNNSGKQDSGEPGINGVTVNLYDSAGILIRTTVTATGAVDGEYRFLNLPAGDYTVEIIPPAGYSSSTGGGSYEPAPDPDNDINLDDNGTFDAGTGTIKSGVVTLGPGDEPTGDEPVAGDPPDELFNKTVDFGLYRTLSLGNLVWTDVDDDGVFGAGDSGLDGVTVNLYDDPDSDGVYDHLVSTTATAGGGFYNFSGLNAGSYVVGFVLPSGSRSTTDVTTSADPNNDVNDDDNIVGTGTGELFTAPVTLAAGTEPTNDGDTSANSNLTVDAGVFTPAAKVSLKKYTNGCDAQLATGSTGPTAACGSDDGQNNPIVGIGSTVTWTYVVTNEGNVALSNVVVTDDQLADSDINCGAGTNTVASIAVGASVTCTATGTAVAGQYSNTATVTADGETAPGTTGALQPVTDPSHYFGTKTGISIKKYTNTSTTESLLAVDDADVAGGADPTANHVVTAGSSITWLYVVTNEGNVVLSNVVVTDDMAGTATCPKTTLQPNESMTCKLTGSVSTPGQYSNIGSVTAQDAVTNPASPTTLDASDPSHLFVMAPSIDVEKHTNDVDADTAAEGPQIGIGQTVTWTYLVHNTGNIALANVAVTDDVEGAITCPVTVLAADDGVAGGPDEMTCTFTGVAVVGPYENNATVAGTPAGPDGTPIDGAQPVTDADPSHYTGVESSLGDTIWYDTNANGIQDSGELGIDGVTVILLDSNGVELQTVVTTGGGHYLFEHLEAGTYTIKVVPPDGYSVSVPSAGSDAALDSDIDPTTGLTNQIVLGAGTTDLTWDAGLWQPVSLGNLVWFDPNNDGVVNFGESGIDGLLVTLYADLDGDGTFSDVVGTQSTSVGGHYLFTGLKPADYQVGVTIPDGYVSSSAVGFEPAPDPDATPADDDDNGTATGPNEVRSAPVSLFGSEPTGEPATAGHADTTLDARANYTVDFGLTEPVSLGDVVFYDLNDNGVRDVGELGAVGVAVTLYSDPDGDGTYDTAVDTVSTGPDGSYLFTGLQPGTYVVAITTPTDYRSSTDAPTSASTDNDVNNDDNGVGNGTGTITSAPIHLVALTEPTNDGDADPNSNLTVDFGIFSPAPSMAVKKYTNGCDAQAATGVSGPTAACPSDDGQNNPVVAVGAAISWTYVVTNTGNVPLTNVVVTDSDPAVTVSCATSTIAVGASLTCSATGTAVAGQYANTATATADAEQKPGTTGTAVTPATDDSHYFASDPGLAIKKYTNLGAVATDVVDDADTAGGSDPTVNHVVPADTAVTWRYVVTNTGNVAINNVAVVDSVEGAVTCPSTTLAAGASMTCELAGTLSAPGQYSNTGSVTGTSSVGDDLSASDPSHAFVAVPSIDVEKHTNSVDADTAADAPRLALGANVTWTYLVHNTGNVTLTGITVVDDVEGDVACPSTVLAADDGSAGGPDEMTCTLIGTVKEGPYANNAVATGTPSSPNETPLDGFTPVTDTDPSHYIGVPLSLGDTVWLDANDNGIMDTGEAGVGSVPVTLYSDPDGDGVFDTVVSTTTTAPDGTYIFTSLSPGSYVVEIAVPTDYRSSTDAGTSATPDNDTNSDDNGVGVGVGMVRSNPITLAIDAEPTTDGDTDANSNLTVDFGIFDPNASVAVKKFTNGCDAQSATGEAGPTAACGSDDGTNNPILSGGSTVTWTYVVTNTGNVPLSNVVVADSDPSVTVECPSSDIAVGASITCSASGTASAGQYENVATVTADGEVTPGGSPEPVPTVTDPSHYFGVTGGLALKKYTNVGDAATELVDDADVAGGFDPAANHVVAAGTDVTWRYVITNTGNSTVKNIALTDDIEGDVTCPKSSLAAGESMTCELNGTLTKAGQYSNTGSVTGTGADGVDLNASDPSNAFVAVPSIDVEKSTNGADADAAKDAPKVAVGSTVTWTYVVHNTGNVPLANVVVTDDIEGTIVCPGTSLAADDGHKGGPDEMTCSKTGIAVAGAYVNNATATGTPTDGNGDPLDGIDPPKDEDPSHYTGVVVQIGDTIWFDTNADGVQDEGEPGISGVVLELVDESGHVIGTTTTDSDGHYLFNSDNVDGLMPDTDYIIQFAEENFAHGGPLEGMETTVPLHATTSTDSDIGEDGTIHATTPSLGEDLTFDGGFVLIPFDLAIDKNVASFADGVVTYTLDVTNNGPGKARGPITIVDTLPDVLTALSASGDGWTCTLGTEVTCVLDGDLMAGGAASTVTVDAEADQNALASIGETSIINVAHVSGTGREITVDNNEDSAEISAESLVRSAGASAEHAPSQLALTDAESASPAARTGAQIASSLLIAAGLVFLGVGFVAFGRRRRSGQR